MQSYNQRVKASVFMMSAIGIFVFSALPVSECHAAGSAGIEVGLDSARALGKGNAVVADPQDASSMAYNPAGITELDGAHISGNFTTIVPDLEYTSRTGVSEDAAILPIYIPSFFFSSSTPVENLKLGASVNSPYGLQNEWSSTGSFKYTGFSNSIRSIYYTLEGAYEVTPWLSVAAGGSYVDADVKQNSKLNSNFITVSNGGPAGIPDANTETDLTGNGAGWNLAVFIKPDEKLSLGAFYRSSVRVSLDGEYHADNLQGPIMQAIFGGPSFSTDVDTDMELPNSIVLGANYKFTDKLSLEVDFGWTGWKKFDRFDFAYGRTNAVIAAGDPSEHKFDDAISINVGASYKLNDHWSIMGGYAFFENAAREIDYSSVFPDGDRHSLATGLEFCTDRFSVSIGYSAQFVAEQTIDNSVGSISNVSVDGDYSGLYHVALASFSYKIN